MLDQVTEVLAKVKAAGAFATRRTGAAGDLRLEVKGVGPVTFPISPATARKLCAAARPARYGLRDQTVLDERVRDCWEIARSRIKIDERRWKKTLLPQLERIQRDLGLPGGSTLKAELYNMLVYEPGQFFVAHQDSETADGMIGTLVVTLPSAFKGGAMVIEHHDEKVTYRGASDSLTFVAFYADCHHEVRPIEDGHRVVLTYNLLIEGDANWIGAPGAPKQIEALVQRIRSHFETPLPPAWQGQPPREPPDRLVYLLDHQYTQKGLGWNRLKNGDAARVAALREAAERLGCEIFLALADVHETWSCEDDDDWYGRRGRRWRDDQADDDDPDSPTLIELCDSDIELRHWIGPSGRSPEGISSQVGTDEICYTKASVDLEPFASEHEGYTGNAGNTVDRWYHRAAVVLWPRERTFVIRAKASAVWAIRELSKTLGGGAVDRALGMAERLLPFWTSAASREGSRDFVENTLRVADTLVEESPPTPEELAVLRGLRGGS